MIEPYLNDTMTKNPVKSKLAILKESSKSNITPSVTRYLIAIDELHKKQGYARLVDIASLLDTSVGSLSTSLKNLVQKGMIEMDDNKHFSLSEEGAAALRQMRGTFFVIQRFLTQILGVEEETAFADALKIEHLLSKESTGKILNFTRAIKKDPELISHLQKEIAFIEEVMEDARQEGGNCVIKDF